MAAFCLIYLALFYGFGLALLGRVGATFCSRCDSAFPV